MAIQKNGKQKTLTHAKVMRRKKFFFKPTFSFFIILKERVDL